MRLIIPRLNLSIGRKGVVVSVPDDVAEALVAEGKAAAVEAAFHPGGPVPDLASVEVATDGPEVILTKPLEEHTVDELRRLASALDIAGRSSMSKDELVEAINEHQDER